MQLEDLRVLHFKKSETHPMNFGQLSERGAFHLETCQRWLWISHLPSFQNPHPYKGEVLQGYEAYLFLLRLACGLESEILGEADVFGQLKDAWRRVRFTGTTTSIELGPWMQRVFEDTKEIRSRFLQNIGSDSYGRLVRRLLKDHGRAGPVLLVGAGQIAHSIGPFLLENELWLSNRGQHRLEELYQALLPRATASVKKIDISEEEACWKKAANVILCIPQSISPENQQRFAWFLEGGTEGRSVIHLGGTRQECGNWVENVPGFYALDDLFSLQSSLDTIRSVQISQAERACEERAKLRALGSSLSLPHGWEDLACFA